MPRGSPRSTSTLPGACSSSRAPHEGAHRCPRGRHRRSRPVGDDTVSRRGCRRVCARCRARRAGRAVESDRSRGPHAPALRRGRRDRRGELGRLRPGRARHPRADRRARQRRGRLRGGRSPLDLAGGLEPHDGAQPHLRGDRLPRRAARDDRGGGRAHRQHRLARGGAAARRLHRLYRGQGRRDHPHPGARPRGRARHHGERGAAEHHGHAGQPRGHAGRRPLRVGQHRRRRRGNRLPRLRARRDDLGRGDPGVTTPTGRRRLAPMRAASIALVTAALLASGCASALAPASAPATGVAPPPPMAGAPPTAAAPANPAGELRKPIRQVLRNGLRLIVQDHRAADIVAVYLYVGVGVRYEKPDELGFAHFQEHMLFKGTDKWGPGYIDRAVEGVGGRTNATTSFDYTDFYIVVPADALEVAVQTLADMAFRCTFDPKEVDRERQVILEEANIQTDNPRSAIVRDIYSLVFADNPYGYPPLGTRATLDAATSAKLKAYNRHYYTPENMTLVVVGPVDAKAVRAAVDRTFGRMPRTGYQGAPAPAPPPLKGVKRRQVERAEQQAYLAMGWQAPRSDDSNGDAVDLLTTILAGTDSARLTKRLRDEENLVSSITMSYAALMGGGIVSLRADLEAKDLARVEQIILEEIEKIQTAGPTEDERRLAVTKFESQHAFDTETSEGLAYAYGIAETTWSLDAELHYVDRLRQITREQIRDAARRFLSRGDYARLAFVPKRTR